MPIAAAGVGAGGGVAAALIGQQQSQDQIKAAQDARQKALQQWLSVNVPDPAQQAIELKKFQVTGQLSPQLETAFQQSQTGLKDISLDPTSRAAEVGALTKMQDLANNGGMDAQSKEQEAEALNKANSNEAGQRGAIVQNFAARGVGGAGAQLAAELMASQGDSNQAAAAGMSSASNAEQRALQALTSSSNMASNLNTQDYSQAAAAAKAQDTINEFNTKNSQAVANNNVTTGNQAQAGNLAQQQKTADANVGVTNQQEIANKGLLQTQFNNEATKATGSANAENGVATQANADASRTANMWGGIGQAIGTGAGATGEYLNQKNNQTNDDDNEDES